MIGLGESDMKRITVLACAIFGLNFLGAQAAEKSAGDYVDDGWLHTKVKTAMVGHGSSGVNIEVYHGVVQMAGFLTGEGNKDNLLAAASGVEGVKRISDQLHLVEGDRTAGEVLDDSTTTGVVKATLLDEGMGSINVEVNRGRVLLSGFVDSDDVRERAIDTVKDLKGVKGVIDGMDIKA
jgi:hyperosmotically inducible protein